MIKKLLAVICSCGIIAAMFPVTAFAYGAIYVSTDYLEIPVGGTGEFYICADNAAGRVDWYGDGAAFSSGSEFVEDSVYVSVQGNFAGTTVIEVTNIDVASYDGEVVEGTNYVTVVVYDTPEQPDVPQDTTPKTDTDLEKYKVMVGDETYYMLSDLKDISAPEGFKEIDVQHNGQNVKALIFEEENLTVYPLKKKSDNTITYFTYSEGKDEFKEIPSTLFNNRQYFFLNIPEQYQLPEGYKQAEVKINGFSIPAYVSKDETDEGFYYVYGIANGKSGFFSYYEPDQSLQRCPDFMEDSKDVEPVVTEPEKDNNIMQLILYIALGVCFVLLIVFIIIFISSKKKKQPKKKKTVKSLYEDDDYFDQYDDEPDQPYEEKQPKKNSYDDYEDDDFLIRQAGKHKKDEYDYFNR